MRARRLLVVALAVALVGVPHSARSVPDAPDTPATVALATIEPLVPTPDGTLHVTGSVTGQASDLNGAKAQLRISTDPLRRDDDLAAIADGLAVRTGQVVQTAALAPGSGASREAASTNAAATATFDVSIPFERLLLPRPGVYYLAVEAVSQDGRSLGFTPSSFPWVPPGAVATPTQLAWLWPLFGTPGWDADNSVVSAETSAQFGRDGRLRSAIDLASPSAHNISWVLEPQTQQLAAMLASPHRMAAGDTDTDVQGDVSAAAWVDSLRQATAAPAEVSAAGYAVPNATAEVSADLTNDLVLATATADTEVSRQLGREVRGDFAWPAQGRLDQRTLNALREAGVTTVALAADAVVENDSPVVTLQADSGPVTGIVGDRLLSRAMEGQIESARAQQLFLSATAMKALDGQQSLIALPPQYWRPPAWTGPVLAAAATAPWFRLTTSAAVLASNSRSPISTLEEPGQPPSLVGVAGAQAALDQIVAITSQPDARIRALREALLRCASSAWINDPTTGAILLGRTVDAVAGEHELVRIASSGTVTFPGAQGRVPVTVSNDLGAPVRVYVGISADQNFRLTSEVLGPVDVAPGQKVSVEVPVQLNGPGPVPAAAQLFSTPTQTYGPREPLVLRTTAYSRVAGWVVLAALLILAGLVAVGTRRRIRAARAERAQPPRPAENAEGRAGDS